MPLPAGRAGAVTPAGKTGHRQPGCTADAAPVAASTITINANPRLRIQIYPPNRSGERVAKLQAEVKWPLSME
jgi:hypothetical protein